MINCLFQTISPFPTVFSRECYCKHEKTRPYLESMELTVLIALLFPTMFPELLNRAEKGWYEIHKL